MGCGFTAAPDATHGCLPGPVRLSPCLSRRDSTIDDSCRCIARPPTTPAEGGRRAAAATMSRPLPLARDVAPADTGRDAIDVGDATLPERAADAASTDASRSTCSAG
jgi:hypothetical protein